MAGYGWIKELTTKQEWLQGYTVMKQLRPHLDEEEYLELLHQMSRQGYRQFAFFVEQEAVAVVGFSLGLNLYHGKHCFVHDLVTRHDCRSMGYGEQLLCFIHRLAADQGCKRVALSSNLKRKEAHRFYTEKMGYDKASYLFVNNLS
ncbi:GNAT family N-acetyltransferase [Melghirimyces algeriensis]|uniref:Acetyltransferase (GNAT) family protein n=1 Tax=Melghirimyces algeriensis TaxID=910412 RepID=A0A521BCU5_9BACL|nr:GNAT family N-acetyltransferase [Melghirimyces algeriensis]SMO44914.1 Acetyltransferase (GNAT) family protein [Melghirimyces algeriensis]